MFATITNIQGLRFCARRRRLKSSTSTWRTGPCWPRRRAGSLRFSFAVRGLLVSVIRLSAPARLCGRSGAGSHAGLFHPRARRAVSRSRRPGKGPVSILYQRDPAHHETPERIFERRWALSVLERVVERLRNEFVHHGRPQSSGLDPRTTCQRHCFSTLNHNLAYCYNDARIIKGLWSNVIENEFRGGLRSFEE